jgi:RNA polymerase sigma-70 factor (ECF subfamily)
MSTETEAMTPAAPNSRHTDLVPTDLAEIAPAVIDELAGLLAQVARGDSEALSELYDRTAPRLFGLVLRIVQDEAEATEITRASYREIRRRSNEFNPRVDSALSWIVLIAHRRAVARVRSAPSDDQPAAHAARPDAGSVERFEQLDGLPGQQSQAIRLAFFDGCGQVEIARRLRITVHAATSQLHLGMAGLRDRLAAQS